MSPNNPVFATKILLDNYYSLGKDGIETPEIVSNLTMKNGFVRKFPNLFY